MPLPGMQDYLIAFDQLAYTNDYSSHVAEIYWNGVLIGISTANTTSTTKTFYVVLGYLGNNNLRFKEIGDASTFRGLYIDNICVEEAVAGACGTAYLSESNQTSNGNSTNVTNGTNETIVNTSDASQEQEESIRGFNLSEILNLNISESLNQKIASFHSFPLKQFTGFKYLVFFVDDMWLYPYDNREYNETALKIFESINEIENLKWTFLGYINLIELPKFSFSDLTPFSNPKHLKVQGIDDCFLRNFSECLIFNIPQTILLCLFLWGMFRLLFNY